MSTKACVRQAARPLSVVSLFASCGIGDLGIREAGGEILVAAELDARRCEFFRHNYPNAVVVEGDLQATKHDVIRQAHRRLGDEELFLAIVTPPCQGMSSNGKGRINKAVRDGSRDQHDDRNELVLHALEVIKRLRPLYVVVENAAEMREIEVPSRGGVRLIRMIEDGLGPAYEGQAEVVEFSAYSVPQSRTRLIAIYTRDPNAIAMLRQHGSLLPRATSGTPVTLREAISDFEKLDANTNPASANDPLHRVNPIRHYDAVTHTPEGATALDNGCPCGDANDSLLQDEGRPRRRTRCRRCGRRLPRPMVKSNGRWVVNKGFRTCYKRMCWDMPAPTVTRNFMTASSDNKLHPEQNRTLSPAEAMRLQTVDRYSYDWGDAPTDRILCDALGDAVPPLFLEKLTRHLAAISARSTEPARHPGDQDRRAGIGCAFSSPSRTGAAQRL